MGSLADNPDMKAIKRIAKRIFNEILQLSFTLTILFFSFVYLETPRFLSVLTLAIAVYAIKLFPQQLGFQKRHINRSDYVVLSKFKRLEHRDVAEKKIQRKLKPNEVVHHINGRRDDNSESNLCVMDRLDHEIFHTWLSWRKRKSGQYPSFTEQKNVLTQKFKGILLSDFRPPSPEEVAKKHKDDAAYDSLFYLLRSERRKLAREFNCPAYLIFHNTTLHEIIMVQPECKSSLLRIYGMGEHKYHMFGERILNVVKKFKADAEKTKGSA